MTLKSLEYNLKVITFSNFNSKSDKYKHNILFKCYIFYLYVVESWKEVGVAVATTNSLIIIIT